MATRSSHLHSFCLSHEILAARLHLGLLLRLCHCHRYLHRPSCPAMNRRSFAKLLPAMATVVLADPIALIPSASISTLSKLRVTWTRANGSWGVWKSEDINDWDEACEIWHRECIPGVNCRLITPYGDYFHSGITNRVNILYSKPPQLNELNESNKPKSPEAA